MINFCTCFDRNYLDKGIALYRSLERNSQSFKLFICCFDELTEKVVRELCADRVETISIIELEENTPGLKDCKSSRSKAEYCWTCTASIIRYLMKKYSLEECTYIDADLYYFNDPAILDKEIHATNADVAIMAHRFRKGDKRLKRKLKSGKYCVEYNYFNNSENAQKCLNWWAEECINWCYARYEAASDDCPYERYGDQKYLEQFPTKFENVHEVKHSGGGVAPWNLRQYSLSKPGGDSDSKKKLVLRHMPTGKVIPLVFYHFQNIKYVNENIVNINSETKDKNLKRAIYYPYLKEITQIRKELKKRYGVIFSTRKSYSNNRFVSFIQKYIMPMKIGGLSDLIRLDRMDNKDIFEK